MMYSFQEEILKNSNDLDTLELLANTFEMNYCIAGYVARQIQKMIKYNKCSQRTSTENHGSDK